MKNYKKEWLNNFWYALIDGAGMWVFIIGIPIWGLYLNNEDTFFAVLLPSLIGLIKIIYAVVTAFKQTKK